MKLYVGQSSDRGSIKKFSMDLLEMSISPALPKVRTLREMREQKPTLTFSLRLHPDVGQTGVSHPDIERAKAAAEALEAKVVVVTTGPRFTPTTHNRERLGAMIEALRAPGRYVAWEPRGVWSPQESDEIAERMDVLVVRDLSREPVPNQKVLYTRLLPFGLGARVTQSSLERLAEQLEGAEEAFVVVQAQGAKLARSVLREWFELEEN